MPNTAVGRLRVKADRLWHSIMEMAKLGATPQGGVNRLALTEKDGQAAQLFARWGKEAGCAVRVDAVGNIFIRKEGTRKEMPPVLCGSHLDTQPSGGKFDGIFGVLAALEVLRTLTEADIHTVAPVEAVSWTNEEGVRFIPAMMGSGVFAGVIPLQKALFSRDADGITVKQALARNRNIAGAYSLPPGEAAKRGTAFFEAHIEQGPVLEQEKKLIGIVTGVQGQISLDVTVRGKEMHSGTTPMNKRRDALVGAAQLVLEVNRIASGISPFAVATVGEIRSYPGTRNTIPGRVEFSVDMRHPDDGILQTMKNRFEKACSEIRQRLDLEVNIKELWHAVPVQFAPQCIEAVRSSVGKLGYSSREILSASGHDAVYLSRVMPTAMIFIPCKEGISHNESEYASPEAVAAGANVLLHAVLKTAGIP